MSTVVNGLEEITALAGADLGRTGWTEVTQERVNTFADATGDHQWIHVDTARAAAGPIRRHHRARLPHPVHGHPAVR